MKTIGLVGGVASGKSLVAKMLEELGAGILDADAEGHAVLRQDREVQQALRGRWGLEVFAADGSVDRSRLARQVFGEQPECHENRRFLEGLLHPRIRKRLEARRDALESRGVSAAVLDAPLLLEAGWGSLCDLMVFVDASEAIRSQRAQARGWTADELARREGSQMHLEEKRKRADVVLPNDSTRQALKQAVGQFWQRYVTGDSR